MQKVAIEQLKQLYLPPKNSHKGQNGRVLIIGGSHLFHAASLWSLKIASRIVDLVHYSSVPENLEIVQKLKEEFRDGIVVPRREIEFYINEDDCILIGPGMVREEKIEPKTMNQELSLKDIEKIENEGIQTYYLTRYLLKKFPKKKWVIDAGALQMMEPEWIPEDAILTPHSGEFARLKSKMKDPEWKKELDAMSLDNQVREFANRYHCIVLYKSEIDYVASVNQLMIVEGGNAGLTKGGTGDVLAGLTAALYSKNPAYLSALGAAYIHKRAAEELFSKMGYWYNASDLVDQIPQTMKKLLI